MLRIIVKNPRGWRLGESLSEVKAIQKGKALMPQKGSLEVENYSHAEALEADITVVEDHGGPKPY